MLRLKIMAAVLVAAATFVAVPEGAQANAFSALPLAHGRYVRHRHVRNYHHRYHRTRPHVYRGTPAYYYQGYSPPARATSYRYTYLRAEYPRPSRATSGTRTGYRRYDGGHHSFRRNGRKLSGYRRGFP